jgi:hypothetical protein
MKYTIFFLALLGIVLIGTIFHETIHLIQSKESYSICYDVGKKSFMHIEGDFKDNTNMNKLEIPAYIISTLLVIVMVVSLIIDFRK